MVRRLTIVSNERTKSETESLGFDSEEYESMNEFFNKEIKKNDAKLVLGTIERFFKDVKSNKLKKYFIEALTKHVFNSIKLYRKRLISNISPAWFSLSARNRSSKINFNSSSKSSQGLLTP